MAPITAQNIAYTVPQLHGNPDRKQRLHEKRGSVVGAAKYLNKLPDSKKEPENKVPSKACVITEGTDCASALKEKVNEATSSAQKVVTIFERGGRDKGPTRLNDEAVDEGHQ